MLWRKRLFTILTILAFLWMALGVLATSSYNTRRDQAVGADVRTSAGYQAGQIVGSTIELSLFFCTGLPLFFLFALLAWRNSVGLRHQREVEAEQEYHQQALDAMRHAR